MPAPGKDRLRTRPSLLAKLKDWDDHTSWQEFYDNYWQLIYNYVLKQGVKEDEAMDLMQETLLSVAKAFRKGLYDPKAGSFKCWLLCVTHNRVTDHFRRRRRWPEARRATRPGTTRTSSTDRVPDPRSLTREAIWEEEWRRNVMERALEILKARVRPAHFQIFHERFIKKHPTARVAKDLEVRAAQVYVITCRLTEKLEKLVSKLKRELDAGPKLRAVK